MSTADRGRVEAIHVTDAAGAPMVAQQRVAAVAGVGLEGDRYAEGAGRWSELPGTGREVTLIEAEEIERLAADHGIALAPGESRRNLTTRGVRLNDLVGTRFRVGAALLEGARLCEPCDYLEGVTGKAIMRPLVRRAGLRAQIIEGGAIAVGDTITPV